MIIILIHFLSADTSYNIKKLNCVNEARNKTSNTKQNNYERILKIYKKNYVFEI